MVVGRKLVVKVLCARNLMPKDGQGSSSAYVQVVFDGQRKATRSIMRDLNPVWDETFEFPITDFTDLPNEILEIDVVDNSRRPAGKKGKFLGRVCLHGSTFFKRGQEQLSYYRLEKRSLFSPVRGELGLVIYYTDESNDGNITLREEHGSSHVQRAAVNGRAASNAQKVIENSEGGASRVVKIAANTERGAPNVKRAAANAKRGRGTLNVPEKGQSSVQRVAATVSDIDPLNEENGALNMQKIVLNAEKTVMMEERVVHKSTRLKRKMASSHEAKKDTIEFANASQIRPSTSPGTTQSSGQPLRLAEPSSGPPPNRRPPSVRFSVPPPASSSTAAESNSQLPSPHSPAIKPDEQSKLTTEQHSSSPEKPLPCSLPNMEPKPTETDKFEGSPLTQSGNETPTDVVVGPQKPATKARPSSAMHQAQPNTPQNELEKLQTLADSQDKTLILQSASVTPSSQDDNAADMQPAVDDLEALARQEEMHLDTNENIARNGEGLTDTEIPPNAEAVQPSSMEAGYALEAIIQAPGVERASSSDLMEQTHYLFVKVMKARSLIAKDILVNPNPYTCITLGNQFAKSKVIPNTLYPEWNQVFALGTHIKASTLEVSLWDQNTPPMQDTFLGGVFFDLSDIPKRAHPDCPLAPQWHRLEPKEGEIGTISGDVMLSIWIGTQSDEAFSDAWHSDTGGYNASTHSKVYLSPKLWYIRLTVIEAQDLQTPDTPRRPPEVSVKVELGFQTARTRVAKRRSVSPFWSEDLMLVGSEPFDEPVLLSVEDHQGPDKHKVIGAVEILLDQVERRVDDRQVASRWFNLHHSSDSSDVFQGRIHLRICLEGGYHVMDEAAHLMSDMRPSAKQLWKAPIGVLELGILGAQNLLPIKNKDGHGTTDAYCVAKYGPKWVRTRTILNSLSPRWNEQYTWEVYDACTVLTLCVFNNGDLEDPQQRSNKHTRIGKVRVRLSTLEVERAYTISYPLMVLQPGGLKKVGDIEMVMRFSCMSMFSLINTYTKPLMPHMHYICPLSMQQQEVLLMASMKLVALHLARNEPALKPEVVQYMLDAEAALWSMRRSKANWCRISTMLGGFYTITTWMKDIRQWRNPITTLLVHVLFIILLCYPELILPTIFFYMFLISLWQFRARSRSPPHIDPRLSQAEGANQDDLDEEFDTQPTSKPAHVIKLRYERLRGIAGRVQMVLGDIAAQGERTHGLLTWQDPRATTIFVTVCFFTAICLYIAPFKLAAFVVGIYFLRHPHFRDPLPSTLVNFFKRLPSQSDRLL